MTTRQLFDLPPEMARLPRDQRGYPIPEFVHWENGLPDFRILKDGWREECHKRHKCWLCGGFMGARKWFVVGPMCSITRTTMEPPSHRLCAEFAVKNCPFLTKPLARRNERDLPEEAHAPGTMADRNPGVTVIWETVSYKPFRAGEGWLITVGDPINVTVWREGRPASREEFLESVKSGLPLLYEEAKKDGPAGVAALRKTIELWSWKVLDRWFPKKYLKPPSEEKQHGID